MLYDPIFRTVKMLREIRTTVSPPYFDNHLWHTIERTPNIRLAGINFVMQEVAPTENVYLRNCTKSEEEVEIVCCCLEKCVQDTNILVQRSTLDLLLGHFPLSKAENKESFADFFQHDQTLRLVAASLTTLLRRDMSLNRRLFHWLSGGKSATKVSTPVNSTEESMPPSLSLGKEKENYIKSLLVESVRTHLKKTVTASPDSTFVAEHESKFSFSLSEIVRILITLLDRPEINSLLLDEILIDFIRCVQSIHSACSNGEMSGTTRTTGDDFNHPDAQITMQIGNMFFMNLAPTYVYDYLLKIVRTGYKNSFPSEIHSAGDLGARMSLPEACTTVEYVIDLNLPALTTFTDSDSDLSAGCGSGQLMAHLLLGIMDTTATLLRKEEEFDELLPCFRLMHNLVQKVSKIYFQAIRSMEVELEDRRASRELGESTGVEEKVELEQKIEEKPFAAIKIGDLLRQQVLPAYLDLYEKFLYAKFFKDKGTTQSEIDAAFWDRLDRTDKLWVLREEEVVQDSLLRVDDSLREKSDNNKASFWSDGLEVCDFSNLLTESFQEGLNQRQGSKKNATIPSIFSNGESWVVQSLSVLNSILQILSVNFKCYTAKNSEGNNSATFSSRVFENQSGIPKETFPSWLKMIVILMMSDSSEESSWTEIRFECSQILTHILSCGSSNGCSFLLMMTDSQLYYLKKYTYIYEILGSFLWSNIGNEHDEMTEKSCALLHKLAIQSPLRIEKFISASLTDCANFTRLIQYLRLFEDSPLRVGVMDKCIFKLLDQITDPECSLEIRFMVKDWVRSQLLENNLKHVLDPLLHELVYDPKLKDRFQINSFQRMYLEKSREASAASRTPMDGNASALSCTRDEDDATEGSFITSYKNQYDHLSKAEEPVISNQTTWLKKTLSCSTPDLSYAAHNNEDKDEDDNIDSSSDVEDTSTEMSIGLGIFGSSRSTGDIHLECTKEEDDDSSSVSSLPLAGGENLPSQDQLDQSLAQNNVIMITGPDDEHTQMVLQDSKDAQIKARGSPAKEFLGLGVNNTMSRKISYAPLLVYGSSNFKASNTPTPKCNPEMAPEIFPHFDSRRILYVMAKIQDLIHLCPQEFINCLCINFLNSSEQRFTNEVLQVLQIRSNQSLDELRNSTYLEFVINILIQFSVSLLPIIPNGDTIGAGDELEKENACMVDENIRVQVKALELIRIVVDKLHEFVVANGHGEKLSKGMKEFDQDESNDSKSGKGIHTMLALQSFLHYSYYLYGKSEDKGRHQMSQNPGSNIRFLSFICKYNAHVS